MANNLRDLRRKMKAMKSTKQVTKAMELMAASKMRKAVENAQLLRRYALAAWDILGRIAGTNDAHPLLVQKPLKKVLVIVLTSDRGLCGPFNARILRAAHKYAQVLQQKNVEMDFIAAGKKGQQFLARTGRNVIAAFDAFSNRPKSRDVRPVSRIAMEGFLDGTYDHVVLVYSNFISALVQEPVVKVLLPFSEGELKSMINELFPPRNAAEVKHEESPLEYAFEPSVDEALERILPQLVQLQVYQAVLESAASEWSARMLAMRNASDSASDFLSDLTLTYNQSRQSMITSELAELSASKAALDPA